MFADEGGDCLVIATWGEFIGAGRASPGLLLLYTILLLANLQWGQCAGPKTSGQGALQARAPKKWSALSKID